MLGRLLVVELCLPAALGPGVIMLGFAVIGGANASMSARGLGWANPVNIALSGMVYVAPLCVGSTVWGVQELGRRGFETLAATTRRGPIPSAILRAAAPACWAVLAYLILVAALSARTRITGAPDGPTLLLGLLAVSLLAACCTLGLALGRATASRLAGPLLAVAIFLWLFVISYLPGWLIHLTPVDPATAYAPFSQPRVALVLTQILGLVGLATLATPALLRRSLPRAAAAFAGGLLVAGSVLTLSRLGPASTQLSPPPAHPVCGQADVHLCLRPENAELLDPSLQTLTAAAAVLRPFLDVPNRFSEPGMEFDATSGPGVYVPPRTADKSLLTEAAVRAILPPEPSCAFESGEQKASEAYGDLVLWAEARAGGGQLYLRFSYQRERVGAVLEQDVAGQRAWVADRLREAFSCVR